jgi:hypothetical protein
VHNDFLTNCETLIACRVVHKADRQAIKDWIDGCADPGMGAVMVGELANMPRTDAWVWSPEIGFGPERVTWPMFKTFDSFKPRTDSSHADRLKGWAEVNLTEVTAKLASTIEEAKANDPKALKARIAELERQLRTQKPAAAAPAPVVDVQAIERRGYDQGLDAALTEGTRIMSALRAAVEQEIDKAESHFIVPRPKLVRAPAPIPQKDPGKNPVITRKEPGPSNGASLPGVQQKILDALAELEQIGVEDPDAGFVAFMAGYQHRRSKGFANALGAARSAGLIEGLRLTDEGRARAQPPAKPRSPAELQDRLIGILGGPAGRILRPLIDCYPQSVDRETLAAHAQYEHVRSKGFANALGSLRSLGFIDYPSTGKVVAKPVLFLER